MKRSSWKENISTSSEDSSDSNSEDDNLDSNSKIKHTGSKYIIDTMPKAKNKRKKLGVMDYEALSKHGYHGGPSVLKIPPPRIEEKEQNWAWSTGKDEQKRKKDSDTEEESYSARQQTRAAAHGEELLLVHENLALDRRDRRASFSQKEKRKRDLGQASRGKSYVEEEKRLLRDSGVYSGFDS